MRIMMKKQGTGAPPIPPPEFNEMTRKFSIADPDVITWNQSDNFGEYVDTSSRYTVVGTPQEAIDPANGTGTYDDSGVVYIYDNLTGQQQYVLNPNSDSTESLDRFGWAVAVNESIIVASAPNESRYNKGWIEVGVVYVIDPTSAAVIHTIENPVTNSTSIQDKFGTTLAISEDYIAVGTAIGKIYIFDTATYTLQQTFTNPRPDGVTGGGSDDFAIRPRSLAVNGTKLIAGASYESNTATNQGAVYVFDIITGQLDYTIENPRYVSDPSWSGYDQFGHCVSSDGNYIVVSSRDEEDENDNYTTNVGAVRVYDLTTGDLLYRVTKPVSPDGNYYDWFGYSQDISGNYIIVGMPYEDLNGSNGNSGMIHLFDVRDGSLVKTIGNPNSYGNAGNDRFGWSVAINDKFVAAGAPGSLVDGIGSTYAGYAYIYELSLV